MIRHNPPLLATDLTAEFAPMYAIIEEGGRQFKVTSGDVIRIDRPSAEVGDAKTLKFDRVLLVAGEGSPKIGAPLVGGATVSADVLRAVKGPKIDIQKYKRRKGYHKKIGHRQQYTEVRITGINV
jgi:large subunit ribosomal protein L21